MTTATAKAKRRGLAQWRVPMGFALAAVFVLVARPNRLSLELGLPIAAAGLALRALAAGHIRKNDALATTGPYAYTRNPLYLGSCLLALGFVIAASYWLLALLAGAMLVGVYLPVIRLEEKFLAGRFGPAFEHYCARVPRLVPRLTPARGGAVSFSGGLYWRHREYNAALGFAAMSAVLAAAYHWGPLASHLLPR